MTLHLERTQAGSDTFAWVTHGGRRIGNAAHAARGTAFDPDCATHAHADSLRYAQMIQAARDVGDWDTADRLRGRFDMVVMSDASGTFVFDGCAYSRGLAAEIKARLVG